MKTRLMEKYGIPGEEYNSSSENSKLLFQSRDLLKKKHKKIATKNWLSPNLQYFSQRKKHVHNQDSNTGTFWWESVKQFYDDFVSSLSLILQFPQRLQFIMSLF